MNRRELIAAIAAHSDAEPKAVDAVLRGFTDVVCATVAKGDPVVLTGFAKFAKIQTKARMGRNPATGEAIKIKASKKARITPLKGFKDIVLGAAPAPKLTKAAAPKAAPARKAPAKAPAKATAKRAAGTAATRTTGTRTAASRTAASRTAATKAPAARTTRATKTTATKAPARTTTATKATTARKPAARR